MNIYVLYYYFKHIKYMLCIVLTTLLYSYQVLSVTDTELTLMKNVHPLSSQTENGAQVPPVGLRNPRKPSGFD